MSFVNTFFFSAEIILSNLCGIALDNPKIVQKWSQSRHAGDLKKKRGYINRVNMNKHIKYVFKNCTTLWQ